MTTPKSFRPAAEAATTRTLTTHDLRQALVSPTELEPAEERLLRMVHGAPLARTSALPWAGEGHPEAAETLLSIELELLRQWKQRQVAAVRPPVAIAAAPVLIPSPRRDKVVQALRAKKRR